MQAALLRELKIENGAAMMQECALLAWDMDKFYDSIDFGILAEELIKRNFPPELMILGTLAHQAPRVLKVGTCISEPIESTGNSILAGCQCSVSFARGLLWELMDSLIHAIPRNPCHQHVDDLAQPLVAKSPLALRDKIVKAGTIVGQEVERLKINLSDKSVVVPISAVTLRAAYDQSKLKPPVKLRVANAVDDVGIEMGGGRRRMAKTQNKRIRTRAMQRARRTRQLVRRDRRALKLVMPGVAPQQAYGHTVTGASKSQTMEMRGNIKTATPFGGTQACLTTTLAWLFSPTADPGVKIPCEQLDAWVLSWGKLDKTDRRETRVTWALALGKILKGKKSTQTNGKSKPRLPH